MKNKTLAFICFLLFSSSIFSQSSEYQLFRQAITELNTQFQSKKKKNQEAYDSSKGELPLPEKSSVTIFGLPEAQKNQLEKEIEEMIDEDVPIFEDNSVEETDLTQQAPKPQAKKKEKKYIRFNQVKMFPDRESPEALSPAIDFKRKEVKWVSSETITTEETIHIDEIKDPKERQRWTDIIEHQDNVEQLNKTGLILAMFNESKDEKAYKKMIAELNSKGYSMDKVFSRVKILDEEDKLAYVKKGILDLVHSVIR